MPEVSLLALKPKSYLLGGGLLLAAVAWWLLASRLTSADRNEIRRLLRQRDAALQSGDGFAYARLVEFPGPVELTVASGLARAVRARFAFLSEVGRRLGPAAAFETGRGLPYLRECGPQAVASCVIEGDRRRARARIGRWPPVELERTPSGWKLRLFATRPEMVLADLENAAAAFEAARARAQHEGLVNSAAALRLFTGRFITY